MSYLDGVRSEAVEDVDEYLQRMQCGHAPGHCKERPDSLTVLRETVITGLRLIKGVDCACVARRTGTDPREFNRHTIVSLRKQGLVELCGDFLRLTSQGRLLAQPGDACSGIEATFESRPVGCCLLKFLSSVRFRVIAQNPCWGQNRQIEGIWGQKQILYGATVKGFSRACLPG